MHTHTHIHTHTHTQEGGEGDENGEGGEDKRVGVIETTTGNKITGEEAPRKSELEKWLKEHPG